MQGAAALDLVPEPFQRLLGHLAGEEPRRHRVDGDVAGSQLEGERSRQVVDRGLARRVGEGAVLKNGRRPEAVHRADVDDPGGVVGGGRGREQRGEVAGQEEQRRHVQLDHLAEPRLRKRLVGRAPRRAGVVHQDVEPGGPLAEGPYQPAAVRVVGDVRGQGLAGPRGRQLGRGPFAGFQLPRRDPDGRPGLQEPLGDHSPDAAGPAGDQRRLAGEIEQCGRVDGGRRRGAGQGRRSLNVIGAVSS